MSDQLREWNTENAERLRKDYAGFRGLQDENVELVATIASVTAERDEKAATNIRLCNEIIRLQDELRAILAKATPKGDQE